MRGVRWTGSLGTAVKTMCSSFSQNMKRAQHNILKTNKIPFQPPSSLSLWILIHYRYLNTTAGAEGVMKHTHQHTHHFLKHTGTHRVSCGNLFFNQLTAIRPCTVQSQASSSSFYSVIKTSSSNSDVREKVSATRTKRWETG